MLAKIGRVFKYICSQPLATGPARGASETDTVLCLIVIHSLPSLAPQLAAG